jgi:hypothetical protein
MATLVVESSIIDKSRVRSHEHVFFSGMSLVVALVVFIGFSRTYYLAALFDAKPLAAPIVHVHGAAFTCWILLFVIQTVLVGRGHRRTHRTLGLLGLALAPLIVLLGVLVALEMLHRFATTPGFDSPLIFAVALSEVAGFAVPVWIGLRLRRRPDFHKRLTLIGTIAMTTAGFGRWPIAFLLHKPLGAMLAAFTLLGAVMLFDVFSTHRVHPATLRASAWVVFVELSGFVVGHTAVWQALAAHVRSLT